MSGAEAPLEVSLDGADHDPPHTVHEILSFWNPNGPIVSTDQMVDPLPKGDSIVDEAMNPIASRADADLRH